MNLPVNYLRKVDKRKKKHIKKIIRIFTLTKHFKDDKRAVFDAKHILFITATLTLDLLLSFL